MDPELLDHLRRAQRGDLDAFCYVVTAQREAALACARALTSDVHRAEDAVQDAFLLALRELPKLHTLRAFPGWMRALVRTAVHRDLRGRRPLGLAHEPPVEAPPGRALQREEAKRLVRAAVAELGPAGQAVIERFYLRGLSVRETAAELCLPPGTVKRRLYEARERLRGPLVGLRPDPQPSVGRGLRFPL